MSEHPDVSATEKADPREGAGGLGWRAASYAALIGAVLCAFALHGHLSAPNDGDYVTGSLKLFQLVVLQALACGAGVLFGVFEIARPYTERDRWSGIALWANALFALLSFSLLFLTRS